MKILDLLVTQCHGKLQHFVDNKELMIHHTVAAAIQLDISPLTERVDPDTLRDLLETLHKPCFVITLTLIRAGCMTRSHKLSSLGFLGRVLPGVLPYCLSPLLSSVAGLSPSFSSLLLFFVWFRPCRFFLVVVVELAKVPWPWLVVAMQLQAQAPQYKYCSYIALANSCLC